MALAAGFGMGLGFFFSFALSSRRVLWAGGPTTGMTRTQPCHLTFLTTTMVARRNQKYDSQMGSLCGDGQPKRKLCQVPNPMPLPPAHTALTSVRCDGEHNSDLTCGLCSLGPWPSWCTAWALRGHCVQCRHNET